MIEVFLSTLMSMAAKLVAGPVIEKLVILLVGKLVKKTDSKVDDEAFKVIKEALEKK